MITRGHLVPWNFQLRSTSVHFSGQTVACLTWRQFSRQSVVFQETCYEIMGNNWVGVSHQVASVLEQNGYST